MGIWVMSDNPMREYSREILSIVRVGDAAYLIRVQISETKTLETICRVERKELRTGKSIQGFTFDSRDFRSEIMNGNIDSRGICQQVGEYHDQLNANLKP